MFCKSVVTGASPRKTAVVRPVQPQNAKAPMLERTRPGSMTEVRLPQKLNAYAPILPTLSGIVTLVSPLQPENAESRMRVTPSGMVKLVSPLQF